jgi:AraC-like DNA-binding protein
LLHDFLRARLAGDPDPRALLVDAVVADMRAAQPGTTVAEIAARHSVSARTLQRVFRRFVGVGPKWVLQRHRLHDAIEQLGAGRGTDWTRLALDLGYFDLAHFIRDFRAVVGRTPAQYEAEAAAAPAAPRRAA